MIMTRFGPGQKRRNCFQRDQQPLAPSCSITMELVFIKNNNKNKFRSLLITNIPLRFKQ